MFYLVNINGKNAHLIGIRNFETNYEDKRTLQESENFIVIQFGGQVNYDGTLFAGKNHQNAISMLKIGDSSYEPNSKFTIEANTKLEVHFQYALSSLNGLADITMTKNQKFQKMVSMDLSHFI